MGVFPGTGGEATVIFNRVLFGCTTANAGCVFGQCSGVAFWGLRTSGHGLMPPFGAHNKKGCGACSGHGLELPFGIFTLCIPLFAPALRLNRSTGAGERQPSADECYGRGWPFSIFVHSLRPTRASSGE